MEISQGWLELVTLSSAFWEGHSAQWSERGGPRGSGSNRQNFNKNIFQITYLCLGRVTVTLYSLKISKSGYTIPIKVWIFDDLCVFSWNMPILHIRWFIGIKKWYEWWNIRHSTVHKDGPTIHGMNSDNFYAHFFQRH